MSTSHMSIRVSTMVLCAVLVAAAGTSVAPSTASATGLTCSAHVNPDRPADYSDVVVTIHSRAGARIATVAHYRTTNTFKAAVANSSGYASVVYWIARATIGYPVTISVVTKLGTLSGSCSTSFTP